MPTTPQARKARGPFAVSSVARPESKVESRPSSSSAPRRAWRLILSRPRERQPSPSSPGGSGFSSSGFQIGAGLASSRETSSCSGGPRRERSCFRGRCHSPRQRRMRSMTSSWAGDDRAEKYFRRFRNNGSLSISRLRGRPCSPRSQERLWSDPHRNSPDRVPGSRPRRETGTSLTGSDR